MYSCYLPSTEDVLKNMKSTLNVAYLEPLCIKLTNSQNLYTENIKEINAQNNEFNVKKITLDDLYEKESSQF